MAKKHKCPPPGLPGYMATFADLMSLLMAFFVLLLSFSEMDVLKFKQIAGSMKYAFGVQNELEVKDIPKGTSAIALEFRPGRPQPTPLNIIQQHTVNLTKQAIEFEEGNKSTVGGSDNKSAASDTTVDKMQSQEKNKDKKNSENKAIKASVNRIKDALQKQIKNGALSVESLGQQVIIRIGEKTSFPSGSYFIQPQFYPTIKTLALTIKDIPGIITISGHTDNINTESELYLSNWDLAAKRSVSIMHQMLKEPEFYKERKRVRLTSFGDAIPIADNKTIEGQEKNRRIDISILQGKPLETEELMGTSF